MLEPIFNPAPTPLGWYGYMGYECMRGLGENVYRVHAQI